MTEPTPIQPAREARQNAPGPTCPSCARLEARIWTLLEETDALALQNLELSMALEAMRGQLAETQAALVRAGRRAGWG